jgi:AcrR family transcriptional regulator
VTIEGVAESSGVAKTTIYRRYRNRRDLLRAALRSVADVPPPPSDLPAVDRLVMLLDQFQWGMEEVFGLRVVATLLLEADDPEFAETFRACVLTPRLELLFGVCQEGVDAGQLRAGVDYRRVIDLLVGSYFARHAIDGWVERGWSRAVVALLLPSITGPSTGIALRSP